MRGTLCKCKKVAYIGHVVHAVDAVDTVCSRHSGCSTQWMQYAVENWYMVVGTLSLVQKGENTGHSGCSMQWIAVHSECSMQWMQYAVCSGIVVYGGGDIVFETKRSNERT